MMPKGSRRWQTIAGLALFTSWLPPPALAADLDVTPPPSVAVVMIAPAGRSPGVRATELVDIISKELASQTRLRVQNGEALTIDPTELGDCPAEQRFTCWARITEAQAPTLSFLLVTSTFLVTAGELRLVTYWLDLSRARQAEQGQQTPTEREQSVFSHVVVADPARVAATPQALAEHFAVWAHKIVPGLPTEALKRGYGDVALDLVAPSRVSLDGRVMGDLGPGTHRLVGAEVGPHRIGLQVEGEGGPDRMVDVVVRSEETVGVSIDRRDRAGDPPPEWLVVTTLGVAFAGGVLLGAGIGDYQANPCDDADPGCDPSPSRVTACELDPAACPATNGVAFLAVGSGLLSAAITTGLGALIFEDQGFPWWSVLAGLLVGGATAGIAAVSL